MLKGTLKPGDARNKPTVQEGNDSEDLKDIYRVQRWAKHMNWDTRDQSMYAGLLQSARKMR